jgi:ATP-dependent DNA helicase RecG
MAIHKVRKVIDKQLDLFEPPLGNRPRSPDAVFERATVEELKDFRENDLFERKVVGIHANELGEYICMWANTKPNGGLIILGLSNKGELQGCKKAGETHVNNLKKAGTHHCPDAPVEPKEIEFFHNPNDAEPDFLLLIRVKYHGAKVVRHVNGKAYWRVGDEKHEMPTEVARERERDFGQVPFEQEQCSLKYPDDFDIEQINSWAGRVRINKGWLPSTPIEQVLANLHLGKVLNDGFVPNMACALLFARDPVPLVPGSKIHLLKFAGEKEGIGPEYAPLKDDFVEGTIPRVIEQAEAWLGSQLRSVTRYGKDGKFQTSPEYPNDAWYELVVNACVHRSYGLSNQFVTVKVFNDHLIVESPGGFMPSVSAENIYDIPPHPRNPLIYHAMWYLEFVRCNNEGAKRIRSALADANLPPAEFMEKSANNPFVRVEIQNDIKNRKLWSDEDSMKVLGSYVFDQLSVHERKVVNYVIEFGQINVSDTQRLTTFSWPRSRKLLLGLVEKGILSQVDERPEKREKNPKLHYILKRGQ